MNRIERLTAEILLLQDRPRTSDQLAGELEVSKRTIIRDMQSLVEIGVPILSQEGAGGGYSLSNLYKVSPLDITWREALLMMLALGAMADMSDSPFSAERTSLISKLRALLPEKQRGRVEKILDKVAFEIPKRAQKAPLLDDLIAHVSQEHYLKILYRSSDEEVEVLLRPTKIFAEAGFWYLQALTESGSFRYRIDRIVSVEEVDPAETNITEPLPYDDPSHPTVRVRLSSRGVRILEREQHLGFLVAEAQGKPTTIEFRCPPTELDWYAKYFGGMASDGIIESPPELIDLVRKKSEEILKIY